MNCSGVETRINPPTKKGVHRLDDMPILYYAVIMLTLPGNRSLQAPSGIPTGGLEGDGGKIIQNSLTVLMVITIILVLFFLIWAGIKWITSEGDKQKVQSARSTLTYAIIGLVIVFLSFFILSIFNFLFGINLSSF